LVDDTKQRANARQRGICMSEVDVGRYLEKAPGVPRTVACLLFEGMTLQDLVGPYNCINILAPAGLEVSFVAKRPGPTRDDRGRAAVLADKGLGDLPHPDVLVLPGGPGFVELLRDKETTEWVAGAHEGSEHTVAVCTGPLLLAATGALQGRRATSAYYARELLGNFGATYVPDHVVEDGRIITAAGTSGGVEAGLRLVEKIGGRPFAEAVQLVTEYDSQPVFGTGDATKAPAEVHERVLEILAPDLERTTV